ncbi:hypothetical protein BKA61DRAFT_731714 [Leptodontidium sp. MPI-SDFR-AT-0119]|nr:hypothetical protein BKA61DRAFT_731714 [Leptodontidium sp. MPI-SDFR-AT-0119]
MASDTPSSPQHNAMDVGMNATSAVTSVAAEQIDSSGVSSKTEADSTSDGETGGSHLGLVNDTSTPADELAILEAFSNLNLLQNVLPDTLEICEQTSETEQTFTAFKKLPHELRRMIWRFSIVRGRLVQIEIENRGRIANPQHPNAVHVEDFRILGSRTLTPAILHASSESCAAALLFYETLTQNQWGQVIYYIPEWEYVYFHQKSGNDPLAFFRSNSYTSTALERTELGKIQRLMVKGYRPTCLRLQDFLENGTFLGANVPYDVGGLRYLEYLSDMKLVFKKGEPVYRSNVRWCMWVYGAFWSYAELTNDVWECPTIHILNQKRKDNKDFDDYEF